MSGPAKGNTKPMIRGFPFKLKRKESPVVPGFTMTINKAQGQSSHHVDIYLESPMFAHGKLNVAISRVTSQMAIKIAVPRDDRCGW
ncbi:Helitron helicase [Phytophthora megakarya]|uniref:Helitron helicase n=1 Tax=Phytophthora megakarya TaxID=4795 RepID=A0A225WL63_9STRA|nr:Helitron helicase [Phytophthora megakarya]